MACCLICDIVNWTIAFFFLTFIGIVLYKVGHHYTQHGKVSTTGLVTSHSFWEHDPNAIAFGLLFPFLFWIVTSVIRFFVWKIIRSPCTVFNSFLMRQEEEQQHFSHL